MARVPPDGCLVLTEPLAEMVRRFMDEWNSERPQTAGRFLPEGDVEVSPVRAVDWLASVSGVPEATISNIVDRQRDGRLGRYKTTELRVADALVTALERPEAFWDGTLTVMPNPSAPRSARAECCGGSVAATAAA